MNSQTGCEERLAVFANKLNYTPDRDSSIEHLNKIYRKYLVDLFTAKAEGAEKQKDDNVPALG